MKLFELLLLVSLLICAVSTLLAKKLLHALLIYLLFAVLLSVLWLILKAPDLALAEAAAGASANSLLLFVTLKKIRSLTDARED